VQGPARRSPASATGNDDARAGTAGGGWEMGAMRASRLALNPRC